jgi:hypothetical protein
MSPIQRRWTCRPAEDEELVLALTATDRIAVENAAFTTESRRRQESLKRPVRSAGSCLTPKLSTPRRWAASLRA